MPVTFTETTLVDTAQVTLPQEASPTVAMVIGELVMSAAVPDSQETPAMLLIALKLDPPLCLATTSTVITNATWLTKVAVKIVVADAFVVCTVAVRSPKPTPDPDTPEMPPDKVEEFGTCMV